MDERKKQLRLQKLEAQKLKKAQERDLHDKEKGSCSFNLRKHLATLCTSGGFFFIFLHFNTAFSNFVQAL